MNIIEAIKDRELFRPFLAPQPGGLSTWVNWLAALRVLHGLPVPMASQAVVAQCTGRQAATMPPNGFDMALFLTGRRSGKSRIAAIIGGFEALFSGREAKLSPGEQGMVVVCAPTRDQARIVTGYLRAVFDTPLLRGEIVSETKEGFQLANGVRIEILAGDFRTVRGYTLLAAIVDEVAFFGYDNESKVRSDTELIRAIKPSLATVQGKLIAISSPYARKGWTWNQHQRNFGNPNGRSLVWNAPSRVMNATLPQSVVDDALAEDLQAAKAEYLGEFRDDVCEFLTRAVVEALVVAGRYELLPQPHHEYEAFADLSGGRSDDATLAIAHREGRLVVIDFLQRWRPPFNPHLAIGEMADVARRYRTRRVTGDNYAAEFVSADFVGRGIHYIKAEKPKSQLYAELLPRLCSGEIELLDSPDLVTQLAALERRTRSGGRDVIDHPPGGHDDLANAVAGVACVAAAGRRRVGAM